jgi:hypothetical protein
VRYVRVPWHSEPKDSHLERDVLAMTGGRLAWITTTSEFAARGVSDARIRTLVKRGRILPLDRGIYARADLAADIVVRPNGERLLKLASAVAVVGRCGLVAEFADPRSESPFESIARVAFCDGGLPAPDLQVWVGGDDGPIGRVDFLWRAYRTIAEADGAVKYADPDRARLQLRRDARLRAAGFDVVHFSWHELVATPDQVINAIRASFWRADPRRRACGKRA